MFSKIIAEDYKDEYFAEDWETDKDYFDAMNRRKILKG